MFNCLFSCLNFFFFSNCFTSVFQDESFPRQRSGPGPRDKFGKGRGRGRYPRGRDERQLQREDEEAKQIAVSIQQVTAIPQYKSYPKIPFLSPGAHWPISRKPWKLFRHAKPLLGNLNLRTEVYMLETSCVE